MWIDVSMPITKEIQVYKNKPDKLPQFMEVQGSTFETVLTMNLHTGTHLDFPKHVLPNGATSESLLLSECIRPVRVLDFSRLDHRQIGKTDLEKKEIQSHDFLLFKTRNSFSDEFDFEFVALDKSGAAYLDSLEIDGVGTDGLGIERAQEGHPTHHYFLDKGKRIIEGLRLKEVEEGLYNMICLPLSIPGVEALPARILLEPLI
ncbi:MAG: cyclase family protein [Candidatus Izemoplasmatales bacterium]